MFRKIRDNFRRVMMGRYGSDALNMTLLALALALLLVGLKWPLAQLVGFCLAMVCLFRTYSRDIVKRRRENMRFLQLFSAIRDRKNRVFRCRICGQAVRVPRGKGKISIRCPKCANQFVKKT